VTVRRSVARQTSSFPRGGEIAAKKIAGNINLAKDNGGKNSLAKIAVSTKW